MITFVTKSPSRFLSVRSFGILMCGLLSLSAPLAGAQDTTQGVDADTGRRAVLKGKAPVAQQLLKVKLPRPLEADLPNGLRILVLEDHRYPNVHYSLTMKAGTFFNTKPGVAELTASMLTEGTPTRTAEQITGLLEENAVNLNASASQERVTLTASGTSDHRELLLDLMTDVLLHPSFAKDRLDNLLNGRGGFGGFGGGGRRGGGGGGGPRGGSGPEGIATQRAQKLFYGDTIYARTPATQVQRRAVTVEDVHAFYDKFYRPNGAVLAITGDVNAKAVVSACTKLLINWQPAPTEAVAPTGEVPAKTETHIYLIDRPGSTQTYLLFGNVAVSRTDPDYIPLVVANRVLGGSSSARLFQNLREDKGYTYGVYSRLSAQKWPGLWEAYGSVRTPVTEAAVKEFFIEFKRIQEKPVPIDELARAKRALIGSFARTLESADSALSRTLERIEYNLSPDYWETYSAQIEAVTPADIQRVARKYLGDNRIQLIAVGEKAQIEEGLKKFGPVTVTTASTGGGAGFGPMP